MNQTTNMFFAFLGGVAVGALATIGVLKKIGKNDPKAVNRIIFVQGDNGPEDGRSYKGGGGTGHAPDLPIQDKPSFEMGKALDTHKVTYDALDKKPDLAEMVKKYKDTAVEREAAEREHPPEDEGDDDYDEEEELQREIGESLMKHPGQMDIEETDGFGHILCQLDNGRKDNLIYLVPEEYAGEVYPLETLTYYMRDDILADLSDTPVDDVNRIIADALEAFGKCGEDPDMVFVRNCSSGIEYEITRVDEYFGAKIYGVSQEEMADVIRKGKGKSRKDEEE